MNNPTFKPKELHPKSMTWFLPTWDGPVAQMLVKEGHSIVIDSQEDFDAIMMTGGEDVSPKLYDQKAIPETRVNEKRDLLEFGFLNKKGKHYPKVGICRGGQLLNVFSGGRMWQDVDGHAIQGLHAVQLEDGTTKMMSSTHHQMMIPNKGARIIGKAKKSSIKKDAIQTRKIQDNKWEDIEILWYHRTQSLCFQPHPEYEYCLEFRPYFFHLVYKFIWPLVEARREQQEKDKADLRKDIDDAVRQAFMNTLN